MKKKNTWYFWCSIEERNDVIIRTYFNWRNHWRSKKNFSRNPNFKHFNWLICMQSFSDIFWVNVNESSAILFLTFYFQQHNCFDLPVIATYNVSCSPLLFYIYFYFLCFNSNLFCISFLLLFSIITSNDCNFQRICS